MLFTNTNSQSKPASHGLAKKGKDEEMNMMNPTEIIIHKPFASLFPIDEILKLQIAKDMGENGFDRSQPIILAQWEGLESPVCLDGHTRVNAAILAGIDNVPVWLREDFDNEDEALKHAIKLQRNRRNMTDAEIAACIEKLDHRRSRGGNRKGGDGKAMPQNCGNKSGRSASAKELAETLNISPRKVEQTRTVLDHAEPDIQEALRNKEISINKAYQETQKRRKEARAAESTSESDPEQKKTESNVTNGERDAEEEAKTPQQEASDTDAFMDDHETEHDASGLVEAEVSTDSEATLQSGEQAEEEVYISVSIRLAQSEVLEQYGLTAEEAIDHYLEYLKPIDDQEMGAYEKIWANFDDTDNAQQDSPQVNAA